MSYICSSSRCVPYPFLSSPMIHLQLMLIIKMKLYNKKNFTFIVQFQGHSESSILLLFKYYYICLRFYIARNWTFFIHAILTREYKNKTYQPLHIVVSILSWYVIQFHHFLKGQYSFTMWFLTIFLPLVW